MAYDSQHLWWLLVEATRNHNPAQVAFIEYIKRRVDFFLEFIDSMELPDDKRGQLGSALERLRRGT